MEGCPRIPLVVKLLYTTFVCVLVPYYWVTYTPWNFLFLCDVALLMTLVALWREDPLLASMPAVGITLPQFLWLLDFLAGGRLVGMAAYMFDAKYPLFVRALSLFHGWLPIFLLWLVWRLGYDGRALLAQTLLTWVLLLISYFFAPAPPPPPDKPTAAVNINYVHGLSSEASQTWMPPWHWLATLMIGLPVCVYLPTDLVLRRAFPQRESPPRRGVGTRPVG
ncbi:hypothetical protein V5E97_35470 [Singulisphaera sp. Ch08]|uniref:Uncharacterized protein n=1 Tax=Singulisphaera sp. Ch08 TaxID=3120278 RepID=A0AAU7CET6_9BACT